jgi:hypothetical protein
VKSAEENHTFQIIDSTFGNENEIKSADKNHTDQIIDSAFGNDNEVKSADENRTENQIIDSAVKYENEQKVENEENKAPDHAKIDIHGPNDQNPLERQYKLKRLLKKAAENSVMLNDFRNEIEIYYHYLDKSLQTEFNQLILDNSTASGKIISSFIEDVKKNIKGRDKLIPKMSSWVAWTGLVKKCKPMDQDTVKIFGAVLMNKILEEYHINGNYNALSAEIESEKSIPVSSVLRLYVDRFMYRRFKGMFLYNDQHKAEIRDMEFLTKRGEIRRRGLSQNDFEMRRELKHAR